MKGLPQFFVLRSSGGHRIVLSDYGARLCGWEVPDCEGRSRNVVLGFPNPEDYLTAEEPYHGAIIGRCAGRIREAQAPFRGRLLRLSANEGPHHLHGGPSGFHACLWKSERLGPDCMCFRLVHPHGTDGYPGDLRVTVLYRVDEPDGLRITLEASANAPTPFAPTHHPFWNLHGSSGSRVTSHRLQIPAEAYLPVTEDLLVTGFVEPVKGTAFDFTRPRPLASICSSQEPQVRLVGGLDHTFACFNSAPVRDQLSLQARVEEPASGLSLEVWSDFPCLQVYSGQKLNGADSGRDGIPYTSFSGLCLEPTFYPDFLNHKGFDGPVLEPGKTFSATILYRVSDVGEFQRFRSFF